MSGRHAPASRTPHPGFQMDIVSAPPWRAPVYIFAFLSAYTRLMSRYDRPSHRVYMSFFRRQGLAGSVPRS